MRGGAAAWAPRSPARPRRSASPGGSTRGALQSAEKLAASEATSFPAFPAAGTLRPGAPPRPPSPHPSSRPTASPPRVWAQPPAAQHRRVQPLRQVLRHGRLPLSDPEGPGTRRGEAPETHGDRVSPRALSRGRLWGFACQPGMERAGARPRKAGKVGFPLAAAGHERSEFGQQGLGGVRLGASCQDPTVTGSRPGVTVVLPQYTLHWGDKGTPASSKQKTHVS